MQSRTAHNSRPDVQARHARIKHGNPVQWAVMQKLGRMSRARSAANVTAFNAARDRFGIAWREAGFALDFDGLREFLGTDWPESRADEEERAA